MKIGIIGAGHIGGNLAQQLISRGHDVSIANSRGPQTLSEVAERTGATPVDIVDAPREADLVIISIPVRAVPELPPGLLTTTRPGAPVIDTGNYYPQRDGQIAAIDAGQPSSAWVSEQVGRPVVKVFNNIYSSELISRVQEPGTPGRRALPVAGDDEASMRVVLELVDELGFDAVDVGGLDESWRFEPGAPAYGPDVDSVKLVQMLNEATR
jgi:predicted dinucleotide-binding enzyme